MGVYDSDMNGAYNDIKAAGVAIDVIRPTFDAFDPGDDQVTYITGDLNGAINASAATLNLINIVNGPFPSTGIVSIDSELIKYAAATGGTLSQLTRGFKGTLAASHLDAAVVDRTYDTFTSYGVFSGYNTKDIDGHKIMLGDKKILIPGKGATFEIDTESLIVLGDQEYQVIGTKLLAPDSASWILWTVHGR